MINADIFWVYRNNFYNLESENNEKITGYEIFFRIIENFKTKFNFSIHVFGESQSEKSTYFNFNGDYSIKLMDYGDKKYIKLTSDSDSIEDFTEKFNYLKSIC